MTSNVMIATVIMRLVAILFALSAPNLVLGRVLVQKYLRPIPLKVLTLRSTYPSLSSIVIRVC